MKPFDVGVLGIGDISDVYISNLKSYDIVSVSKARRKAELHGLPKAYAMAAELIADPDIDIVLNLTLPAVHAELTTMALEAGEGHHLHQGHRSRRRPQFIRRRGSRSQYRHLSLERIAASSAVFGLAPNPSRASVQRPEPS
jgi:hypothetical protein